MKSSWQRHGGRLFRIKVKLKLRFQTLKRSSLLFSCTDKVMFKKINTPIQERSLKNQEKNVNTKIEKNVHRMF